jgi:signal transduction histidine kinase
MLAFQARVISGLGAAAGYLVLAIVLFRRNGLKDWTSRVAVIYLLLSIAWGAAEAVSVWQGLVPSVSLLAAQVASSLLLVFPTLALVLTVQFLERPGVRGALMLGGGWLVVALLVGLNAFGLQDILLRFGVGNTPDAAFNIVRVVGWGSVSASAVAVTLADYMRTTRPLHRNRIMFWLMALCLTLLGEGLTFIEPIVLDTPQLGIGVRLMGMMLITIAVISYHLPNLRTVARRSLSGLMMIAVSSVVYFVSFLLFQQAVVSRTDTTLTVVGAVGIALLLAVVQRPMLRLIQNLSDRLLYRQRYDPAHALREYNTAIGNILDLNMLVSVAVGIISEALEVRRGALLLITDLPDGGADARVIRGMGDVAIDHLNLSAASSILADLQAARQPLTQYEIDILPQYRAAPAIERTMLQALDMEVYVPIRSQSVLVGVFALGHKASGDPYSLTDLDVLMTLAGQTAVAVQNARLVTDLKQANAAIMQLNDELTRTNRRLEKLDQAKTDFIEIASHELRTPLTQVRGYADILADSVREGDPSPAQMSQISQGIGRAAGRLEEIITAMLDVSQIDSEALAINRTPLTMNAVLRFALDSYKDAIKARQQTLNIEGIDGLPAVQGDFQRLCQAFGNVIGNCIKYTPDGGRISIVGRTIGSQQGDGAATYIEVVISDSGIGIDPADQDLIFEKFYRVGPVELHSTGHTKFKGGGPGLGLPIARGVIQAHGGKIWVESEGQDEMRYPGSKFHILLPAAPPSVTAELAAQPQSAIAPFTTGP